MEIRDRASLQSSLTESAKEQVKLRSSWLNGISIATFAIGTLAPTTRLVIDGDVTLRATGVLVLLALSCLVLSYALHLAGSRILKRLD